MDDNNVQNSLCITSMKQELSGPTEAHGPFIILNLLRKRDVIIYNLMMLHSYHSMCGNI